MSGPLLPPPLLTLTKPAFDQVWDAMGNYCTFKDMYVRVGIHGGGCSGFEYVIDLVRGEPKAMDIVWHQEDPDLGWPNPDIRIAVDPISSQYLRGCVIDWVVKGLQQGFKFANPMARSQCGCGRSFSV
jgi:iron-sulfur cluster assembly accessory protein